MKNLFDTFSPIPVVIIGLLVILFSIVVGNGVYEFQVSRSTENQRSMFTSHEPYTTIVVEERLLDFRLIQWTVTYLNNHPYPDVRKIFDQLIRNEIQICSREQTTPDCGCLHNYLITKCEVKIEAGPDFQESTD